MEKNEQTFMLKTLSLEQSWDLKYFSHLLLTLWDVVKAGVGMWVDTSPVV